MSRKHIKKVFKIDDKNNTEMFILRCKNTLLNLFDDVHFQVIDGKQFFLCTLETLFFKPIVSAKILVSFDIDESSLKFSTKLKTPISEHIRQNWAFFIFFCVLIFPLGIATFFVYVFHKTRCEQLYDEFIELVNSDDSFFK